MAVIRPTHIALSILMILFPVLASAQQPPQPAVPAPIPTQIPAAHRVFISNAGYDATARAAFERGHQPNRPYNDFYAAMKKWGRYELVANPADADLVFVVRFTAPISDCDKITSYEPQLQVTIVDVKTHFVLWTITEPVEGAYRKATWDRNFDQGLTALMEELKALVAQTPNSNNGKL